MRTLTFRLGLTTLLICLSAPVMAERPMNVDDAGTLPLHGAKLEFGWSKDDKARGIEAAAGYSPIENVELEISGARARDTAPSPSETVRGVGGAIKWVPLQPDTGLSAGLKYAYGNEKVEGQASHSHALLGLMSWNFAGGSKIHLNLGRELAREAGDTEAENTWGVGLDYAITESLHATAETFGSQHAAPDRSLGLRYEISPGLKVSGAIGRGNDRTIANTGIAWEF
jgi:hypothetical protein